ncbi:MAG: hypothetical protein PHC88_12930 [Terrimicrobiaceae bacterium]|nr:hypothetical protein [Terrimicrobiaceae bacterium]
MKASNRKCHLQLLGWGLGIFLVVGQQSAFCDEGKNLLKNPSFEVKGSGPEAAARDWKSLAYADGPKDPKPNATFTLPKGGQDGATSARIDGPNEATKAGAIAAYIQDVPVTPGKRYHFSVYVKADAKSGAPVPVLEQLSTAKFGGVNGVQPFDGSSLNTPRWKLVECYVQAGPDTEVLRVALRFQGYELPNPGWVQFDKASLTEVLGP